MRSAAATLLPSPDAAFQRELDVDLPAPRRTLARDVRQWVRSAFGSTPMLSLRMSAVAENDLTVRVQLVDGPGGALFPSVAERQRTFACEPELRGLVRSAQTLILCVNAARPEIATLRSNLPPLLWHLAQGEGYLPYRAVLVLLTQVDRVAARFLADIRQTSARGPNQALGFFHHPQHATCASLCRQIHATELARSLIGDDVLHQLWIHVAPGRKFGVGVASALGCSAHDGDDAPRPLGLEETLYFLLNGDPPQDRRLGTLWEYGRDDRGHLPRASRSKVPLESIA
jgi:hypothetical protein